MRVAKAFVNDLAEGVYCNSPKITAFDNIDGYDGIVFQGNITLHSFCSHHHLPFIGTAHTAYIPSKEGKIIGLSKLNRIVEFYSRRPQVQENLTMQIHEHINEVCGDNLGVALTTANVFQKFEILIKNQTKAMRTRAGRKFMVSHATADIIREAQRLELNFKGVDVTEAGIMRYAGYDIIENSSFPDDSIMFASMTGDMKTDAIQLGTSMSSDFNNLEVERTSNFGRLYGMLLTFAIDIYVVRPEEVCYYSVAAL
jgi:GTP cyclohydrolase I